MKYLFFSLLALPLLTAAGDPSPVLPGDDSLQDRALAVLEQKCNNCHRQRNRRTLFTAGNMEAYAPAIQRQVFVTRRMPKGKERLSGTEEETLKRWLEAAIAAGQR